MGVIEFFDRFIPAAFLKESVECLRIAYRRAFEFCRENYPAEEAHDLLPHVRRANCEMNWRTVASRYPQLQSGVERNDARNTWHDEFRCGPVVLTQSAVAETRQMVRPAKFRTTLANSVQLSLYSDELPPEGDILYGILLHGPDQQFPYLPAFVHVAFPSRDCSCYQVRIDLMKRFPHLASTVADVEMVSEDLAIRLRATGRENA